jgi:hypothetical protein
MQLSGSDVDMDVDEDDPILDEEPEVAVDVDDADDLSDNKEDELEDDEQAEVCPYSVEIAICTDDAVGLRRGR